MWSMNDQCFSMKASLSQMSSFVSDIKFDTKEYWGGLSARRGDIFQRQCDDIAAEDQSENRCIEFDEQGWCRRT